MANRRSGDLNLSLTGSQISAISSSSRLNSSSGQPCVKKTSSLVDVKTNKTPSNAQAGKKPPSRGTSPRSAASSPAAPMKKSVGAGVSNSRPHREEDFLAFFENSTQPKIKRPASAANANHQNRKPLANSVKVLWNDSGLKPKTKKPAWASKPNSQSSTARSDQPHNIFRPNSARSSDDELETDILDGLDNSLSHSINKLHNLQMQLSGVNKHSRMEDCNNSTAPNSVRSISTAATLTPGDDNMVGDFIQGALGQSAGGDCDPMSSRENFPLGSSKAGPAVSREGNTPGRHSVSTPTLANNVSQPGQAKSKASLASLENSYQNIKHKSPVNRDRMQPKAHPNSDSTKAKPLSSPLPSQPTGGTRQTNDTVVSAGNHEFDLERGLKVLNHAATKIQKWYRRHKIRTEAGHAAVKRLLGQKRQEHEFKVQHDLVQSVSLAEMEEKKSQERKKRREEHAKEARQQAVKELQKKREERRSEVKKIAEEEIAFLQASGKVTKTPSNSSLNRKKKLSPKAEVSPRQVDSPRTVPVPSSAGEPGQYFLSNPVKTKEEEEATATTGERTSLVAGSNGKTTLDDLYSTLKKLEEDETLISARSQKHSWLDDLEKDTEDELDSNLTAENLEKLNLRKDPLSKSGFLTNDKLKSIINFLDDVQVTERLSEIDTEISRMNEELEKPALLVPSAQEVADLEHAQAAANEVTTTVLSQRLELDEKKRTVSMLQKALNQQRELTVRHARETEKEMKKRLDVQKEEYEEAIKRHLSFIDQLIDDKKTLGEKCEKLVTELKTVDKKYQDKFKGLDESHTVELTKLKEVHTATEKLRREKWIEDKTKKIKEMTVKGLEPEIQRLIAKHKSEVKKMRQIQEADLLEADERAAQKYVKMTEDLRDQLATEKEAACARERELCKQRFEKQLQQEEEAFQQQRRRLYQEVQEEKDRVASSASRQRTELEKLQRQLEDSHRHALESMKDEFNKSREEQERRHTTEAKDLREKLKIEKESWEENYMKRHETWLVQKERELRDQVKKERDKEIEHVIERLEEDASTVREENERTTEQKVRRMREKYEVETRELEQSERKAVHKFNEIKAKMTEVEGENERLKVIIRQKDVEILDNKKLVEKMNSERSHVSDIIRQEFADRIVATDEESKRIKHEISELRARHRIEVEKMRGAMEDLKVSKDEEMEEVHKRVKQAIVKKEEVVTQLRQQYQAASKRADHLEGLLDQQRKQLLKK